jgi:26S proteasome regulatory subunit N7
MATGDSKSSKGDNPGSKKADQGASGKKKATGAPGSKKASVAGGADPGAPPYPDMALCQLIHRLLHGRPAAAAAAAPADKTSSPVPAVEPAELEVQVFDKIVAMKNPTLYASVQRSLAEKKGVAATGEKAPAAALLASGARLTADDLASVAAQNDAEMKELQEKLSEAQESAGEMEVVDTKVEMARFAAARLDKESALGRYQDVIDTPKLGGGKKIDAYMEKARVASFYGDVAGCDAHLASAVKLAADSAGGGDWDRRNRLKAYQALQFLLHRDFAQASKLLLDGVATFSSAEICTYAEFLTYAVLTNLLHLPRPVLHAKILNAPELLGTTDPDVQLVLKLAQALYDCHYKLYLQTLLQVEDLLLKDRYLFPHAPYWMRELHILGYRQFLDAYSSVTIQAMADAFGVSPAFVDSCSSRYIAENRLSAKIDKYGGVIVTNRPDHKNAQYRDMIQKGDLLLNRIQKLARVVDL